MSAAESTIATLQHQLHRENQRRFEQIEKNQENQQKILNQIVVNTADLPKLKDRVDELETDSNRVKGGGAMIAFIFASWEALRFFILKR